MAQIIKPDLYWDRHLEFKQFMDPLDYPLAIDIDDPMAEIVGLCFNSFGWCSKYILNTELANYQMVFQQLLWSKKYPLLIASRGAAKTFSLAVYAVMRALFYQGSKIIVVSASFRQAKRIFEEIETIYKRAPLLRAAVGEAPRRGVDHCIFNIGESVIKALPLGDGSKIRGERASCVLIDEVDSVDAEVFNVVVRGFAATQLDPMSKVKEAYIHGIAKRMPNQGNQIVIAGTAGFNGGNFHKLFVQYLKIIQAEACDYGYNLVDELGEDLGDTFIDSRNYGIVKLPWQRVPEGILDRDLISNAKITMSRMLFNMEYECLFADVSRGFFIYKSIDNATSKGSEGFNVAIKGKSLQTYVMGVDPARTGDAFAIVVIEVGCPHKIVYVETLINKKFSQSVRVMRKIMEKFGGVKRIACDLGGGGLTVEEMLELPEYFRGDQKAILNRNLDNKIKDGDYIFDGINFSSKWIEEANFLLQKNIEDCRIMFPTKVINDRLYSDSATADEIDYVYNEVNEMKKELYQISVTQTKNGNRHFDIDPTMEAKRKKVRPRKDRYSALLLANYCANQILEEKEGRKGSKKQLLDKYNSITGGWSEDFEGEE